MQNLLLQVIATTATDNYQLVEALVSRILSNMSCQCLSCPGFIDPF